MAQGNYLGQITQALETIVCNNDTEGAGTAIDGAGCSGITFVYNIGESLDTLSGSVYWTVKLQKSTDSAFTTPVAAAAGEVSDETGNLTTLTHTIDAAAEDGKIDILHITVDADYRYYRILFDATGTHTNGTPLGAIAIKHPASLVS